MKLGSKFLKFLRTKTKLLKRLQCVIVVDGVNHTQKDDVERSNGGSLKDGAEAFVLFLCGAQLVLRSSVLKVLDFNEVDVTLKYAKLFGTVCGW